MDYNLAGIRNRVLIDKLDDDEFDADVVDRFINDTQRDIFNEYELSFQEKIFQGTIPIGSTMFKFPSDVARVQSQVISGPDGQAYDLSNNYIPFRDFNQYYPVTSTRTSGPISYWTLYADNMLISQPTDQEYTMTTYYISKPITLVQGSDVPQIPEEFSELLVLGAFQRIQERNEDYDLAAATNAQYQKLLNLLVSRYGYRRADGPIIMKNSQVRT